MNPVGKELKEFKKFQKNYNFEPRQIVERDGIFYCDDFVVDNNGKIVAESPTWINVGYKLKGPLSKTLSNLFPYEFEFRGKKLKSIENFFQGIKFKDAKEQDMIFNYWGIDSNNIKIASNYDWRKTGDFYWQGRSVNRFSKEYQDLVTELYVSAIQNPLYRNVVKNTNKYILHSIGKTGQKDTAFTRYEFEKMLNTLSAFLKTQK